MNVASLELCKELYELSGWVTEATYWDADSSRPTPSHQLGWYDETITAEHFIPAYDLGYLLRKLPNYIPTFGDDGDDYLFSLKPNFEGNEWEAAYWGIQKSLYWNRADTPEDAAAKLAIGLFKQGVLK